VEFFPVKMLQNLLKSVTNSHTNLRCHHKNYHVFTNERA